MKYELTQAIAGRRKAGETFQVHVKFDVTLTGDEATAYLIARELHPHKDAVDNFDLCAFHEGIIAIVTKFGKLIDIAKIMAQMNKEKPHE